MKKDFTDLYKIIKHTGLSLLLVLATVHFVSAQQSVSDRSDSNSGNLDVTAATSNNAAVENLADINEENTNISTKKGSKPSGFELRQNYPNPFNPTTEIQYTLPKSTHVILKVYDMLGRPIKTLINKTQEAGVYTREFNARGLTSGMYLYRLEAGDYQEIRKMILIK